MDPRNVHAEIYCWQTRRYLAGVLQISDNGLNFVLEARSMTSTLWWKEITEVWNEGDDAVSISYDHSLKGGPEHILLRLVNPVSKAVLLNIAGYAKRYGRAPGEDAVGGLMNALESDFGIPEPPKRSNKEAVGPAPAPLAERIRSGAFFTGLRRKPN